MSGVAVRQVALVLAIGLGAAACANTSAAAPSTVPSEQTSASTSAATTATVHAPTTSGSAPATTTAATTSAVTLPPVTLPPTTLPTATLPTTTHVPAAPSSSTTTTEPPTTVAPPTVPPTTLPPFPIADGPAPRVNAGSSSLPFLAATIASLTGKDLAISVSVWRDHEQVYGAAAGATNDGGSVGTGTPFVLASVSKMVTALSVARLVEQGRIDLADPVPWSAMGIVHDAAWDDVTVRELLAHTSGMPVSRKSWLDLPGPCSVPLAEVMALPPRDHRGEWRYSNGNYCALGLLVEHVTGESLADAAHELVFAPIAVDGPHLSTDGALPGDAPYTNGKLGVERLSRLGGAGTWVASSDAIARMMDAVSDDDRVTLAYPGVMRDQYGWGHTGTVDGAKACAWVMEDGRTVVVGLVSGNEPSSGSELCDALVSALAIDLGEYAGEPVRTPA